MRTDDEVECQSEKKEDVLGEDSRGGRNRVLTRSARQELLPPSMARSNAPDCVGCEFIAGRLMGRNPRLLESHNPRAFPKVLASQTCSRAHSLESRPLWGQASPLHAK